MDPAVIEVKSSEAQRESLSPATMKRIILVRHARVAMDEMERIAASELPGWVARYDRADIDSGSEPPRETREAVSGVDYVLTSELKRTKVSAWMLGLQVDESDPVFNEAEVSVPPIPFLKLSVKSWLTAVRILQLLGMGRSGAILKASKRRVEQASEKLIALSREHDSVVLIGHGGMNWLMRKTLKERGWSLHSGGSHENWSATIWIRSDEDGR